MEFFMEMAPPTSTAQMKKVSVVHGRPVFYEPKAVKEAKAVLVAGLLPHVPPSPLMGPLELRTVWLYPRGKSHRNGEWRSTRPDTDNIEKMLKDCMTRLGFWEDDAQVARETVEKKWSDAPTGIVVRIEQLE